MATLPRTHAASDEKPRSSGSAEIASGVKHKSKKSKRLTWTLGRKKARDEAFVADRNGETGVML